MHQELLQLGATEITVAMGKKSRERKGFSLLVSRGSLLFDLDDDLSN